MAFPSADTLKNRRQTLINIGAKDTGKNAKPVFLPRKIERNYNKRLQARVKVLARLVREVLVPDIPRIVAAYTNESGVNDSVMDTWSDDLRNDINIIEQQTKEEGFDEVGIATDALLIFLLVNGVSKKYMDSSVKTSLGITAPNIFKEYKWLNFAKNSFVEQNELLVNSITPEYLRKLETLVRMEIVKGTAPSKIQRAILSSVSFRKTEKVIAGFKSINPVRRSAIIATDQTTSLYSELNKTRQLEIGVDLFTWRTRLDERVRGNPSGRYPSYRPSHWVNEGKVFSWKTGSTNGIWPGSEPLCRCFGEAYYGKFPKK